MMMASALLALVGAEAMSIALTRRSPFRVVPAAATLSALLLVVEWVLSLVALPAAAVVLYLHVATFGGALVSGFWSLINERFDPYTARQVVGRIGTGAAAGGLAGGMLALLAAQALPVPSTLLMLAGLNGLAVVALRRARGRAEAPAAPSGQRAPALALPLLARHPVPAHAGSRGGPGGGDRCAAGLPLQGPHRRAVRGRGRDDDGLRPVPHRAGPADSSLPVDARSSRPESPRAGRHRRPPARGRSRHRAPRCRGAAFLHRRPGPRRSRDADQLTLPIGIRAAVHPSRGRRETPGQGGYRRGCRQGGDPGGKRPDRRRARGGAGRGSLPSVPACGSGGGRDPRPLPPSAHRLRAGSRAEPARRAACGSTRARFETGPRS